MPDKRRTATVEELKALAHPLRLRILRLCLDRALTNQELADRLRVAPASVLRHVRILTETGLLAAEEPRRGPRGVTERPYRATRLSWYLSYEGGEPELNHQAELALVDAYRAELAEQLADDPDTVPDSTRVTLWLTREAHAQFIHRMVGLVEEFETPTDPDQERYSFFWAMHPQPNT